MRLFEVLPNFLFITSETDQVVTTNMVYTICLLKIVGANLQKGISPTFLSYDPFSTQTEILQIWCFLFIYYFQKDYSTYPLKLSWYKPTMFRNITYFQRHEIIPFLYLTSITSTYNIYNIYEFNPWELDIGQIIKHW